MTNLTPVSSFDPVPQIETTTLVLGGPGGPANLPAQALLNRTQWLYNNASAGSAGPYAAGTGSANAYTASFVPAITATADGLKLRFTAAAANTGASTFAPNGVAAAAILGQAGLALQGGEIAANGEVEVTWSATYGAWLITACSGGSVQVPDATASHHAASKSQLDSVSAVANAAAPSADLSSTATGKGTSLLGYLSGTLKVFLDSLAQTGSTVGAALIGFVQSGTGASARTTQDKLREIVSVKDFGAKGDSATDDTAAIQAAINACQGLLYFPSGNYICGQVNVANGIVIIGEGSGDFATALHGTTITPNSTTTNVFVCDTGAAVTFRDLLFKGNGQTAGAGITLKFSTPTQGVANLWSRVENVMFDSMFIGVNAVSASSYSITGCVFWNIVSGGSGLQINNTYNNDLGDQSISDCTFHGSATGYGLVWNGGGGTRIVSNKFLMPFSLIANLANSTATQQLVIANNSFDVPNNTASAPVQLNLASGSIPFNVISVTGNVFVGYASIAQFLSITGASTAPIGQVNVTGNIFQMGTGGTVAGVGLVVLSWVNNFTVSGNTMIGPASSPGVYVYANCTQGYLGGNEIDVCSPPVNNLSAGTSVCVRLKSNSGATTSVSDGGTITHGLGKTPAKVWLSGSVVAQTYTPFNITSTTFQVAVRNTSGASGTAATIFWEVEA